MLNYVVTSGFTVGRLLSMTTTAALSGYGTGECWRNLKAHPGTGKRIIGYSFIGGTVGGIIGVGLGLLTTRNKSLLILSQSMYGALITAAFANVHSTLKNKDLKLPGHTEPIKTATVSTLTGGLIGACIGLTPGSRVLPLSTMGMLVGFVGHHLFEGARMIRLEFLIRQNYPELFSKLMQSEEWITDQMHTNPYYVGPVTEKPEWYVKFGSLWGDFGKNTEEKRRRFEAE